MQTLIYPKKHRYYRKVHVTSLDVHNIMFYLDKIVVNYNIMTENGIYLTLGHDILAE